MYYYLNLKKSSSVVDHFDNSGKKGTLILFYADWCGHCSTFKPIWNKLKMDNKDRYNFHNQS